MTFFSHRPGFSNFPSLYPDFPDLYFVRYRTQPLPHKINTFFLLFSYFRAYPTTLLLKILGGRMHGPPPSSNFGGTVPPSPPRFPPLPLIRGHPFMTSTRKSVFTLSHCPHAST